MTKVRKATVTHGPAGVGTGAAELPKEGVWSRLLEMSAMLSRASAEATSGIAVASSRDERRRGEEERRHGFLGRVYFNLIQTNPAVGN